MTTAIGNEEFDAKRVERSPSQRLSLNAPLVTGMVLVVALLMASVVVPAVRPYGPTEANPVAALQSPSAAHPFGTDETGLDIFVRAFYAPRIDFPLALGGVGLAVITGVLLGVATGFSRGLTGELIMRVADVVQAFPLFILAVVLVSLTGNHLVNVVWVLAFLFTPVFLRLTRSRVLTVRELRYIEAAIAIGNPKHRLVLRHVLPNSLGPVIVQAGNASVEAILTIAGLSFLGVGVQVPTPEWGGLIQIGARNLTTGQWWTAFFPGLVLVIAVCGFALISDGIENLREVHR